jgi:hypothetical protein
VEFLIVLAVLVVVVLIVGGPLRREYVSRARAAEDAPGGAQASELAELEAAREAKYREIRDAELDHRTGKLSDADFEVVDQALRAEAVEILHELDRVRGVQRTGVRGSDTVEPRSPGSPRSGGSPPGS